MPFDEDDQMHTPGAAIANVAATAVGATYTATEQGILNTTRNAVNEILVALRAANIIPED